MDINLNYPLPSNNSAQSKASSAIPLMILSASYALGQSTTRKEFDSLHECSKVNDAFALLQLSLSQH